MLRFFLISLLVMSSVSCSRIEKTYKKSTILMDTLVTITVVSSNDEKAEKAIDKAFAEIKRLETLMSFWSENSEIAAIYKNSGQRPVKVSPDTVDLIEKALFVSEKTYGAFDPTIGSVMRLWDFKNKKMPSEISLKQKLEFVDYRKVKLDKAASTVFLAKKGMSFDTGGILKGYAADRAVATLKEAGIKAGLVAIAGDIRGFGVKPDGKGWRVGIRNPRSKNKEDEIVASLELKDEAISTSGDYERFFTEGDKLYHHIITPWTGRPATGCRSVTVVAKEAYVTDGFSTGIFVLGPEKGLKAAKDTDIDAFIVDREGGFHVTEGIKNRLVMKRE